MNIQKETVFPPGQNPTGDELEASAGSARLTHLQLHVLRGLADGDTFENMADELQVSLQTIQTIMRVALLNLNAASEGHAIAILMREKALS